MCIRDRCGNVFWNFYVYRSLLGVMFWPPFVCFLCWQCIVKSVPVHALMWCSSVHLPVFVYVISGMFAHINSPGDRTRATSTHVPTESMIAERACLLSGLLRKAVRMSTDLENRSTVDQDTARSWLYLGCLGFEFSYQIFTGNETGSVLGLC